MLETCNWLRKSELDNIWATLENNYSLAEKPSHVHVIPKDVIATLGLNHTYYAS